MRRKINDNMIEKYVSYLYNEEKSKNTIDKYLRDVKKFKEYVGEDIISKEIVIEYKKNLQNVYKVKSVNSMIASINSLFNFLNWNELKIKAIKEQSKVFCPIERELTKEEYIRLSNAAKNKNERLYLIIQTICGTGIRVSELEFFTVEAIKKGEVIVSLKGKTRTVFIVKKLREKLLKYIEKKKIKEGCIFVTRNGKSIDRTNIWREMKSLCVEAKIDSSKVFPHNLRHLFARTFYEIEKDIAKLADILGHSSINTTRIYIISTGIEHQKKMEQMHLII